ncbi:MAG: HAMP domain-containing protein [Telmatospirillum sp.]|nr:HAMP domain-containing protein [Telmatospirillum sp.]
MIGIAVIAVISVAGSVFGGNQIDKVDQNYQDILAHEEVAKLVNARAGRQLSVYIRDIYSLTTETTDEGNARGKAQVAATETDLLGKEAEVLALLPAMTERIRQTYSAVTEGVSLCRPVVKDAAEATTAEDILKVAARLKKDCEPRLENARISVTALTDDIVKEGKRRGAHASDAAHGAAISVIAGTLAGLAVGVVVMLLVVRKGITGPLAALRKVMGDLAGGNLAVAVSGVDRKDEVGEMARTVQVFKDNALRVREMEREQAEAKAKAEADRKRDMLAMADSFEAAVMGLVKGVSGQATEMRATAQSLASGAEQSSGQAATVAAAAQQATANVQTVASATEELSSSISEISRQVVEAAKVSAQASEETAMTNARVEGLARAADKIGEVVKLINDIASQTNLLALNATIEAARAGDAGKGFAVVAGEVKHLANQTGKATEEISGQIAAVQEETRRTVEAIRSIGAIIDQVRQISSGIASAVEEQGAATQEIARNVQEAAMGTQDVSQNIDGISASVSVTLDGSRQVLDVSSDLARNSETMRTEVTRFLDRVRAG